MSQRGLVSELHPGRSTKFNAVIVDRVRQGRTCRVLGKNVRTRGPGRIRKHSLHIRGIKCQSIFLLDSTLACAFRGSRIAQTENAPHAGRLLRVEDKVLSSGDVCSYIDVMRSDVRLVLAIFNAAFFY